tara:strand:- start:5196 stop:5915 length:720 start_codon:yes stop_codon:yes gene_type:complete
MLSESQLPTIINSISKTDNEVLYYTLNKPKVFKEYEQEDKRTLATYLIGICSILGIKEVPTQDHIKYLTNLLVEEMPNFTVQELNKALRMAMVGKLSVDNNHYQSLTPMYLSSIVNAYKKHKLVVYKRYKQELDKVRREKTSIKPTDKEVIDTSINLINLEYEDYLVDPDEYRDSDFRYTQYKYIYQFLLKYGLVDQLYKYNDRDLKTLVVNVFFEIKKSNSEVKQWLRDNYMRKSKKS